MLMVNNHGGYCSVVLVCDECGKSIENPEEGNAVWDVDQGLNKVLFIHKSCDTKKHKLWNDASHFFIQAIYSLNCDPVKENERFLTVREFFK